MAPTAEMKRDVYRFVLPRAMWSKSADCRCRLGVSPRTEGRNELQLRPTTTFRSTVGTISCPLLPIHHSRFESTYVPALDVKIVNFVFDAADLAVRLTMHKTPCQLQSAFAFHVVVEHTSRLDCKDSDDVRCGKHGHRDA